MSLEIHRFPHQLIGAASAIPADQLVPGGYTGIAAYLQSLDLPKPTFIEDTPIVVRLDDNQRSPFETSLSIATPTEVITPDSQPVSRFGVLQLALGASIGNLLSIPDVRSGALVQDIFPKTSSRSVISSSYGSESEFAFHNDLSFLDESEIPDFVTLGCIRNIEGASTSVASIKDIIDRIDDKYITELRKPQYGVRHTYHRGLAAEHTGNKQSVVLLPSGEICLGVDMTPQTPEAQTALIALRRLLKQVSTPHQLQPGEILVLPNRFAVHSRDPFTMSTAPGNRRWLQRVNIGTE